MWTWERDTLTINQDGTFTMSYTANDGSTNNNTPGTGTLSPDGAITLVINAGSSQSILYGDMAANKTVMVTTAQSSINDYIEIFTKSAAGSLAVTISPNAAVSAGAMWNVDGGSWQTSGATLSNLSVGSHTVAFNNITGWTSPASQTINISSGQNTSVSGAYAQQTGSLTVTTSPAGVAAQGAMWNVDGGSRQTSGATLSNLSVGSHTVAFNNITGWTSPASQTINISSGHNTSVNGAYAQQTGSLTVTTSPAGVAAQGAMWNVDGGSWQASGTTVSGLAVGSHTVAFNSITGWSIPSDQTANVSNGQTASAIGTYSPVFAAIFTASITSGKAPLTVHFTDSSVGNITKWLWNFGDGQTGRVRSRSHTYSKAGSYTVTLTVIGAEGTNTCTQTDYITVYAAPKANFSATPMSGKAPLQVNFANESTGLVTSWLWRFGDGATSTDESPVHTYNRPGTYTAMLTVSGPGGTGSKTLSIQVTK
jgi:PKD repeat protein